VVVWVHGGAFRAGDRRHLPPTLRPGSLFQALTDAGIAVATVDYRLSREAVFPAQLDDVKAAVAYLVAHAAELGVDAGRLGMWGESAGGTLAALAGLDPAVPASAVVGWYTVADLRDTLGATEDDPLVWLFGGRPTDLPELAAQASPVVQARPDGPAFLLVHGDSDRSVPWRNSEELHRRLIDEGTLSTLRLVTGADHCFEGYDDVDGLIAEAVAFFVEQLAP
jgi:acetyl esterase/lipase